MLDYIHKNIRESAVLTNDYVSEVAFSPLDNSPALKNQIIFYIDFTKGSLTSAEIKIEFSHNGQDWYQETISSLTSGVDTLTNYIRQITADGKYRVAVPIKDSQVRISVKGTGTVTGSEMSIIGILGTA